MAWTSPRTWVTGELVTASLLNTHVRDNLSYLKNAPTFDGNVTVSGTLTVSSAGGNVALLGSANTFSVAGGQNFTATGADQHEFKAAQAQVLRMQDTSGNSPYLAGYDSTGATRYGYIQFTAAGTLINGNGNPITLEGFGTHTFSSSGTGGNIVKVENTSSGTGNYALVNVKGGTTDAALYGFTQGYTTGTWDVQASAALRGTGVGGISIAATDAAGAVRFYSGGTTEAARFDASHHFIMASGGGGQVQANDGSAGAPGIAFGADTNTGFYRQNADQIHTVLGGVVRCTFDLAPGPTLTLVSGAYGTGASGFGPLLTVQQNTSGSAAPGVVLYTAKNGNQNFVWGDTTGVMRVHSAQPSESTGDTIGTVIGTQTSQRSTKNIYGAFTDYAGALRTVLETPLFDFDYKSGAYSGQRFVGITTDDSPEFGMDDGRSFNPVTAFGFTVAAFKALEARVRAIEEAA